MDTEDDTIKIDGHRPTVELDVEIFAESASGCHAGVQVDKIEAAVDSATSTAAVKSCGSRTSHLTKVAPIRMARSSPVALSRSARTTLVPLVVRRSATAAPMPLLPPVTRATRSFNFSIPTGSDRRVDQLTT